MMMESTKDYLRPNWKSNRKRIILFADILGFTQMVKEISHSILFKQFRSFVERLKSLMEPLQAGYHLRLTIFSDTIVIGADSCTIKNFNLIVKASAILQYVCYEFHWPINGCIACGDLTFDIPILTQQEIEKYKHKKIVPFDVPILLGNAMVDAYKIISNLFCYGIVLHKNMEPLILAANNHSDLKLHQPFSLTSIPSRDSENAPLYYLSWIDVATHTNNGHLTKLDIVKWLTNLGEGKPERIVKYINNTKEILNNIN